MPCSRHLRRYTPHTNPGFKEALHTWQRHAEALLEQSAHPRAQSNQEVSDLINSKHFETHYSGNRNPLQDQQYCTPVEFQDVSHQAMHKDTWRNLFDNDLPKCGHLRHSDWCLARNEGGWTPPGISEKKGRSFLHSPNLD